MHINCTIDHIVEWCVQTWHWLALIDLNANARPVVLHRVPGALLCALLHPPVQLWGGQEDFPSAERQSAASCHSWRRGRLTQLVRFRSESELCVLYLWSDEENSLIVHLFWSLLSTPKYFAWNSYPDSECNLDLESEFVFNTHYIIISSDKTVLIQIWSLIIIWLDFKSESESVVST